MSSVAFESGARHCERSEAIHGPVRWIAASPSAPRNDGGWANA